MSRLLLGFTVGFAVAAALFAPSQAVAQIDSATDVTQEEYMAVRNAPEGGVDRQVKVVDIGKSNVAVGILHRDALEPDDGPARGIVHTLVTEVYYIVSGAGTLMTGGTITERGDIPEDTHIVQVLVGESYRAAAEGGRVRDVSEGDIVVIPGGVFHGWTAIPDHVTYLSIRPDPDKVLPAGWVNPLIQ
jgi:mannose-6-phosphate isomerase-like protein (cupin superfamily)